MTHTSKNKLLLGSIFALGLLSGVVALFLFSPGQSDPSSTNQNPVLTVAPPTNGPITIKGMVVCLPHLNTEGPQTLECAYGLKDELGRYYGLKDTDPGYKNISNAPMDLVVEVSGVFNQGTSSQYQSIGVITITSLHIADTPKRTSLTGEYLCLPHTDTTGPQTEECAAGLKTDDGAYYAIDFGLMSQTIPSLKSGDRISAEGVLTPIEQLSSDHWQKYPIKGIFSITNSVNKLK